MKTWAEDQIEYWEKQSDLEFLNYFADIKFDKYDPTKLGQYDLYVYNRYKRIIRDKKLSSILDESRILNFNQFNLI